jgi:putative PIN family toxin of toxin-antitoxin system
VKRAVLDPSVLVSALITPDGPPAGLLVKAREAQLELIVSPQLLDELEEVLRRKKFRRYVILDEVGEYVDSLRKEGTLVPDPEREAPITCRDPEDEYLLALAFAQKAVLVSSDSDLLHLTGGAPICGPGDLTVS